MLTDLTVELPVNEFHVNVDVQEEHENNNNIGEMDRVTDHGAPQRNIPCHSSPD